MLRILLATCETALDQLAAGEQLLVDLEKVVAGVRRELERPTAAHPSD